MHAGTELTGGLKRAGILKSTILTSRALPRFKRNNMGCSKEPILGVANMATHSFSTSLSLSPEQNGKASLTFNVFATGERITTEYGLVSHII
jgi:hypothetical protein